ncbi:hypothetical protein AB3459_34080, partial [Pseudomonas aeruginosa]
MLKLNAVDTAPLVSSDTPAPLPPLRAQQIAFEQALPAHRPPAPRPPFDKGDETTEAEEPAGVAALLHRGQRPVPGGRRAAGPAEPGAAGGG